MNMKLKRWVDAFLYEWISDYCSNDAFLKYVVCAYFQISNIECAKMICGMSNFAAFIFNISKLDICKKILHVYFTDGYLELEFFTVQSLCVRRDRVSQECFCQRCGAHSSGSVTNTKVGLPHTVPYFTLFIPVCFPSKRWTYRILCWWFCVISHVLIFPSAKISYLSTDTVSKCSL